jgi:large subunit ribosomal protein L38e
LPEELKSIEEFMTTLDLASVCYVKRLKKSDTVKLKLRTKKRLYTFKTTPTEANKIVQSLNIPVEEI